MHIKINTVLIDFNSVLEQNIGEGAICWQENWVSSVHLIHFQLYMGLIV